MNTIAIDFDGVISAYTGWKGAGAPLDDPVTGAIQAIRDYQDAGLQVVIHTTRADSVSAVAKIAHWLNAWGLEHRRLIKIQITAQKPPAVVYLDDRAWCFTGKFPSPSEILNFKPWWQP